MDTLLREIKLIRPGDIDALAAALKRARVASGMCRIAFDHRVQKLGINLVDFGVWGTADKLQAALRKGAPRAGCDQHHALPAHVRTACLVTL